MLRSVWRGPEVDRRARAAIKEALLDVGEFLLDESNKTVPHMDGILEQSGEVSLMSGKSIVKVSYNTPYAIRLHEHPEYHFLKSRRGKWLELTIQEQHSAILAHIEAPLRRELGG